MAKVAVTRVTRAMLRPASSGQRGRLTPQGAQPADGGGGPGGPHLVDAERGQEHQHEQPAHALQRVRLDVLHLQPALLIEAVEVLDLWAKTPLGGHLLDRLGIREGHVRQQGEVTVQGLLAGHHHPEAHPGRVGQAHREGAQPNVGMALRWAWVKTTSRASGRGTVSARAPKDSRSHRYRRGLWISISRSRCCTRMMNCPTWRAAQWKTLRSSSPASPRKRRRWVGKRARVVRRARRISWFSLTKSGV